MREDLGDMNGRRLRFQGIFRRYGIKTSYSIQQPMGFAKRTILLTDVKRNGRVITDHLWFNLTKGFENLGELTEGDIIQFHARVRTYLKGYGGYDNKELDYKLSHPTKIKLIRRS